MNYLAIGPYCYGIDKSPAGAVAHAKQHWSPAATGIRKPLKQHFTILESAGDFSMDAFGGWRSTDAVVKTVQTSSLARKD